MTRDSRHELAEARSLALHETVARRIADDPTVLARARERVLGWIAAGQPHAEFAEAWLALLDGPSESLLSVLTGRSEQAIELRQVSPFAGVVPPRERWALWRATRP